MRSQNAGCAARTRKTAAKISSRTGYPLVGTQHVVWYASCLPAATPLIVASRALPLRRVLPNREGYCFVHCVAPARVRPACRRASTPVE
jgi:hypothetical protein